MNKKIKYILLSLFILIPAIVNAKFDELKLIDEQIHMGAYEETRTGFLIMNEEKIVKYDYMGNIIASINYNSDTMIGDYNYEYDLLAIYDETTKKLSIKDSKLNTIVEKTMDFKFEVYRIEIVQGGIAVSDSNNYDMIYVYDELLNPIGQIDIGKFPEAITDDKIYYIDKEKQSDNKKIIPIYIQDIKTGDIEEKAIEPDEYSYEIYSLRVLKDGQIIIHRKSLETIEIYDKTLENQIGKFENAIYSLCINKELYFFSVKIQNIDDESEIPIVYKYNSKTNELIELDSNEGYEIFRIPVISYMSIDIEQADKISTEIYEYDINNDAYSLRLYQLKEFNNEYYVLLNVEKKGKEATEETIYEPYLIRYTKDLKEKEIKKLKTKKSFSNEKYSAIYINIENNEIVIGITIDVQRPQSLSNSEQYPNPVPFGGMITQHYILDKDYKINTNISGSGKIDVISSCRPDKKVQIKATPEEGYVLKSLYIVDENGTRTKIDNLEFTMPRGDVLIEATFEIQNPETNDLINSKYLVGIVIILITTIPILNYLKHKKLKYKL